MLLEGKYGDSLIPVLVDALGQLFMIVTGLYAGAPKILALDADGRILAHLIGYDTDGAVYRTVSLDPNGNLIALMKGLDGVTLRTIAVDASGIMKANLSAQDLNYLKFRPVYGSMVDKIESAFAVPHNTRTSIISVTGKGSTVGGTLLLNSGPTQNQLWYGWTVDGTTGSLMLVSTYEYRNLLRPGASPLYLSKYDPVDQVFIMGISPGITFEESISFDVLQQSGGLLGGNAVLNYALIP
uniref:Uncharacterized protein n=1 Tax=viral metagenome TaxID=1070528 RepID=A0A6H1ZP73_9ZZZZ